MKNRTSNQRNYPTQYRENPQQGWGERHDYSTYQRSHSPYQDKYDEDRRYATENAWNDSYNENYNDRRRQGYNDNDRYYGNQEYDNNERNGRQNREGYNDYEGKYRKSGYREEFEPRGGYDNEEYGSNQPWQDHSGNRGSSAYRSNEEYRHAGRHHKQEYSGNYNYGRENDHDRYGYNDQHNDNAFRSNRRGFASVAPRRYSDSQFQQGSEYSNNPYEQSRGRNRNR